MGKRVRHFVGVESSEQLAFIDELQELGLSSTIDLPELVVVGDQSSGKSSVLQAITEVSLPVGATMCTRFPIRISFRQTSTSNKYPVKATIVPGRQSENDEALLLRIKDFMLEKEELTSEVMKEIIEEATECIFGERKPGKQLSLSDATLRIERSGPDEMHWTIVDLPGLKRNDRASGEEAHAQTNAAVALELARSYLANERNIVLVVIDDVDVERHKIFELVEDLPGLESRCIGVLTKCDRKQEGSDDWMVKLLQNDLPTVPHFDHGWFGLRNRIPAEAHITDAERDEREIKEFAQSAWEGVAKDRTGIRSLITYVDKERRAKIQSGLPHIIAEIRRKLQECESDLSRMGEARDSPKAQRYFVFQFCNEMQKMANATLIGQYQDVPSEDPRIMLRYRVQRRLDQFFKEMVDPDNMPILFSSYEDDLKILSSMNPEEWEENVMNAPGMYSEIYKEAKISEGRSLPGSIHPDVEEKMFRKLTTHWERIARSFVEDVKDLARDCHDVLLRIAIPNSKVRLEVSRIIGKTLEEWNRDADAALSELIEDNQTRPLVTRHPILISETIAADKQRGEILLGKKTTMATNRESEGTPNGIGGGHQLRFLSTLLSQVLFVRARLESYYRIALYRFIDNVAMQVVERHVLGPKCPMLTVSVQTFTNLDDGELNSVAGEDETDIRMRARLEKVRSRYVQALEKWERLRVL
ncbi:interferon-induced GTP-binding protein Mx [Aspergillus udagawae]|uniref:Interferon-induced GTP-binding protein Mx n=1 Tax=Aspergillus udagawae TaxID=91492 RepID=A0A8H3XPW6_9EURO|nr:interferon-induced GTP-binding protein Mx [Aspergillus udagawae]